MTNQLFNRLCTHGMNSPPYIIMLKKKILAQLLSDCEFGPRAIILFLCSYNTFSLVFPNFFTLAGPLE